MKKEADHISTARGFRGRPTPQELPKSMQKRYGEGRRLAMGVFRAGPVQKKKENCIFYESLWSKLFIFFHWLLFSRNFWMELKRRPLSIRQPNFHKFMHLCNNSIFIRSDNNSLSKLGKPYLTSRDGSRIPC